MLAYPDIDPVAVELGPVAIHWYGLMYLAGFGAGWWLSRLRARDPRRGFAENRHATAVPGENTRSAWLGPVAGLAGGPRANPACNRRVPRFMGAHVHLLNVAGQGETS